MTHSIRRARPEDAAGIAAVNHASWEAAYRGLIPDEVLDEWGLPRLESRWMQEIQRPRDGDVRLWVVEEDGALVAYARTGPSRDEDSILAGSTAEVYGFYVHPARWGAGVAGGLMDHVLEDLRARGFEAVTLNSVEDNERARAFYERVGFTLDRAAAEWYGASQVRYRREL